MKTLAAYFGLSNDGTRVSASTSIAISLILSLAVSLLLRVLFPGFSPVVRLVLWAIAMFVIFRWAAANAQRQDRRPR
ncbi:hypothetical protein [Sanguibacter sp. 25GB23B1]|uniref:hypothetical protein n=1 Tax=unclassified Sanguibacter TaxID=2645534 RepID=UPI0032AEFB61